MRDIKEGDEIFVSYKTGGGHEETIEVCDFDVCVISFSVLQCVAVTRVCWRTKRDD